MPDPVISTDCTLRKWNGGTYTCITAGARWIICAGEDLALDPGLRLPGRFVLGEIV